MRSNVSSELPTKMRKIKIAAEIQRQVVLSDSDEHINHKTTEYYPTSTDR